MYKLFLMVAVIATSSCVEKGDFGSRTQIELVLKDGGTVVLVCPEYDRKRAGAHGIECYIKR